MAAPTITSSKSVNSGGSGTSGAVVARRIRFLSDAPAGAPSTTNPSEAADTLRRFTQPRPAVAAQEPLEVADLLAAAAGPEPTDYLDVVLAPRDLPGEMRKKIESWLAAPSRPDAPPAVTVELDGGRILWRAGKALIQGREEYSRKLLSALIDFAFYEGELRRLEQALLPYESTAANDVALAFRIGSAGRAHWDRFGRTIESLSQMRLTLARLEPHLYMTPRLLALEARRAVSRLRVRTDVEDRLESLNDRLEACEELYEGAVDRITDHRWYRKGFLLEVSIVVLLIIEAALLAYELYHRLHRH